MLEGKSTHLCNQEAKKSNIMRNLPTVNSVILRITSKICDICSAEKGQLKFCSTCQSWYCVPCGQSFKSGPSSCQKNGILIHNFGESFMNFGSSRGNSFLSTSQKMLRSQQDLDRIEHSDSSSSVILGFLFSFFFFLVLSFFLSLPVLIFLCFSLFAPADSGPNVDLCDRCSSAIDAAAGSPKCTVCHQSFCGNCKKNETVEKSLFQWVGALL